MRPKLQHAAPRSAAALFIFLLLCVSQAVTPSSAGAPGLPAWQGGGRPTPSPTPVTRRNHSGRNPSVVKSPCGAQTPTKGTRREVSVELSGGVKLEMVEMPRGSFCMGSSKGLPDEKFVHRVTIEYLFYMGKFEVTQAQWRAVGMDETPNLDKGDNLPVGHVSWYDAMKFCEKLSRATGDEYRLPTEAEWEYACRAGTTGEYAGKPGSLGWYQGNSNERIKPGGGWPPNKYGLYDMAGNVWEWCVDKYHSKYINPPKDGSAWVDGSEVTRVLRGGAIVSPVNYLRSAYRGADRFNAHLFCYGLRVVRIARADGADGRSHPQFRAEARPPL